jgi:hypothetical protein
MQQSDLIALTGILVALQFTAFGWRIAREIGLSDENRRTWLPVSDWLNLSSMSAILIVLIHALARGSAPPAFKSCLAGGFILIATHPLNMAMHYCIFLKQGRYAHRKLLRTCPDHSDVRKFVRHRTTEKMKPALCARCGKELACRWECRDHRGSQMHPGSCGRCGNELVQEYDWAFFPLPEKISVTVSLLTCLVTACFVAGLF